VEPLSWHCLALSSDVPHLYGHLSSRLADFKAYPRTHSKNEPRTLYIEL
jgi:hypothetical protein